MFFVKRRSDTPFALWGSNWNTALLFAELLQKLTAVVPVFGRRFVKKVREKRILPPSAEEVEKTLRKFSFTSHLPLFEQINPHFLLKVSALACSSMGPEIVF